MQRVAENLSYEESAVLLRCPASSSPMVRLPHLPTAATRSGRFFRHRRRSHRSPLGIPVEGYPLALICNTQKPQHLLQMLRFFYNSFLMYRGAYSR